AGAVRAADVALSVQFSGSGSGSVSSSPAGISCTDSCKGTFAAGTTVTLTATPGPRSAVDDWSNGQCQEQGNALSYHGPACTLTLTDDTVVYVTFTTVTLSVQFSGGGSGYVTSSPPGISCTEPCKGLFAKGTTVTLTASPDSGSAVDDWSNDQCKEQGNRTSYAGSTCTVTLTDHTVVYVTFKKSEG